MTTDKDGYEARNASLETCRPQTVKTSEFGVDMVKTAYKSLFEARQMGLCSNCEEMVDCTFPAVKNGVVYCKEYK